MEVGWLWMRDALTLVVAWYVFVLIFVRRMNGWYYDIKLMRKRQQYPLPPGDMGWPLIGNFLPFYTAFTSGLPDSFLNTFISKYGKKGIYKTHLFGQPTILVSASELCREVLRDEQRFKLSYTKSANELILRSNRFMNTEEHRRFRHNILSPIMGQNALSVYMEQIEDIVINSLETMANSSQPIELFIEAAKVSFNTILHIALGPEDEALVKELEDLFHVMHEGLFNMAIDLPGFAFHEAIKARKMAAQIIQLVVDVRKDMIKGGQQKTKKDLIDIILEIEYDNGCKLEDESIIDIIIGLVFGAQMTTANAIMWTIIFLLENPHVMKKAKEEQQEIMKARPPSQEHLDIKEIKQMVYLTRVINEMLRRVTPTSFVFREATIDTNINGYLIPKGWKVISYVRGVHMDPENHPNPEKFNPSRLDDYKAKGGAFLPFGTGSRTCAGSELARLEIAIFLHHFLLGYKFERVNPECPITYLPLAMPKDKCLVEVSKL